MQPPIGSITDVNKQFYIEREADRQTLLHLQRGDIVTVIEPRQQGKTSLINALRRHLSMQAHPIVYIDVSTTRKKQASDWYADFCTRLLKQLAFLNMELWPALPRDASSFRSFLAELSMLFVHYDTGAIVVLDELATLHFPGSTEFFAVLREIYNSRDSEQYFQRVTFMLVGVFRPKDLIQDSKVSPFNVAVRITLDDFTNAQVLELMGRYKVNKRLITELAEGIYYWTSGQPYLCQVLCSKLSSGLIYDRLLKKEISPDLAVAEQIDLLFRSDDNHIKTLINRFDEALASQTGLFDEIETIVRGGKRDFSPALLPWQEELQLMGIIKEAPDHTCMIRNRIYARALDLKARQGKSRGAGFATNISGKKKHSERLLEQLKSVFTLPKFMGRFAVDIFGRHEVAESSSVIMGWVLIIIMILLIQGFVQMDVVVSLFRSIWEFFSRS
jgi:hypothetical protein